MFYENNYKTLFYAVFNWIGDSATLWGMKENEETIKLADDVDDNESAFSSFDVDNELLYL